MQNVLHFSIFLRAIIWHSHKNISENKHFMHKTFLIINENILISIFIRWP